MRITSQTTRFTPKPTNFMTSNHHERVKMFERILFIVWIFNLVHLPFSYVDMYIHYKFVQNMTVLYSADHHVLRRRRNMNIIITTFDTTQKVKSVISWVEIDMCSQSVRWKDHWLGWERRRRWEDDDEMLSFTQGASTPTASEPEGV